MSVLTASFTPQPVVFTCKHCGKDWDINVKARATLTHDGKAVWDGCADCLVSLVTKAVAAGIKP